MNFLLANVHVLTLDCGSTLPLPPLCDSRRRRYSKIREEMLDRRRGDRPAGRARWSVSRSGVTAFLGGHSHMTSALRGIQKSTIVAYLIG